MAWKLKKSKATVDEQPAQTEDSSPEQQASASQYERPVSSGAEVTGYDLGVDRTVMLLNDSDFLPGLIPSSSAAHHNAPGVQDDSELFPAASEEDLDKYLRGESSFDSGVLESPAHQADSQTQDRSIDLDDIPERPSIDLDDESVHSRAPIELDDFSSHARGIDFDSGPGRGIDLDLDEPALPPPSTAPTATTNGSAYKQMSVDDASSSPTASEDETDYISSALSASDEAVASFRSAAEDKPAPVPPVKPAADVKSGTHPVGAGAVENWDLDAFAPYQPPGGGAVARPQSAPDTSPSTGAVPIEESLVGSVTSSRLIVRLGQFSASYELTKAETTIGRPDPRMSVFPDVAIEWDDAVSRAHCRVLHKHDGDYVEDTGSTNGTRLNDKTIAPYKPTLLSDGDRIGVGEKTEINYIK